MAGAQRLRAIITDYWFRRGFDVTVQLVMDRQMEQTCWWIRSDMLNGLPIKRREKAVVREGVND
jgi:hypothetical protein